MLPPTIAPSTAPAIVPDLVLGRLARLRGAVAQRDVAHLVRHDAGDFAFGFAPLRSCPRLTNIGPPGSANALISLTFTTLNVYLNSGCRSSAGIAVDEPPADVLDVRRHVVVAQNRQLLLDLRGRLLAELHVLRGRVFVLGALITVCADAACADTTAARTTADNPDTRMLSLLTSLQ